MLRIKLLTDTNWLLLTHDESVGDEVDGGVEGLSPQHGELHHRHLSPAGHK